MRSTPACARAVFAASTIVFSIACSRAPEGGSSASAASDSTAHPVHSQSDGDSGQSLTPEQLAAIDEVKKATAAFSELAAAQRAGYSTQYPAGCASTPDGAQGFHYLNEALVDDKVELLRPELVMYEPGPNGQRNLIGVDYIVPLTASETPPTLLGQEFMRLGPPLNVWALHIWAWRPNPNGMFAQWNPKVSCAYDGSAARD